MTQLQLPFLAFLMFLIPSAKCSDLGRDGFNFYKDYLRTRSDDNTQDTSLPDRMLYFYRTPMQLSSAYVPNIEQEHSHGTENTFKNHMLNKELLIREMPRKRTSKTSLSFMLFSSKPYHYANNILEDEMDATPSHY